MINDVFNNKVITIYNIENLDKKLKGELPVNRLELFELVNTWGRTKDVYTYEPTEFKCSRYQYNDSDSRKLDLSNLDVSQITDFSLIFFYSNFTGDISKWNVSKAIDMHTMFANSIFNGDISNWNVSNVKNMKSIFECSKFNGDISKWNVSKVFNAINMFYKSEFNGDISNWNTKNFQYINHIFDDSKFNGNIFNWNLDKVHESTYAFHSFEFLYKWNKNDTIRENKEIEWFEAKKIELNLKENKKTLNSFLKENNIDPTSNEGLKLIEIYNETQNKLESKKSKLNDLKLENEISKLAIKDFENF